MNNRKNEILHSLKDELGRLFMISFGVFLFILFFQPFPLDTLDFNNRLLYVTGFGVITFVLSCLVLILLPITIPKLSRTSDWESGPPAVVSILLWVVTGTAFVFYIHFVGKTSLSLYIVFKVALVCLLPVIILIILYKNKSQERVIELLQDQNKFYLSRLRECEKTGMDEEINILTDSRSDKLIIKYADIVSIQSADNYIEINYLTDGVVEKRLIRNTLKNFETQLIRQKSFIRCHRTSIVNILYIEKLIRNYNGYSLKLSCCNESMPVSRHYLKQVKEALAALE